MTRKSRIRILRSLKQLACGSALITDDGETWIIDLSEGLEFPASGNVTIEGVQAGLDRLKVDWIGPGLSLSTGYQM